VLSEPTARVVAPVVGQQRTSSDMFFNHYAAAPASSSLSPAAAVNANMYNVVMPTGMLLG